MTSHRASGRVLVVDDNPKIHEDFRKILGPRPSSDALEAMESALFGLEAAPLETCTFEVQSASQGAHATSLVGAALDAGAPFSVAFVDIRMPPGWDGVQTARALWGVDPDLQIVLCTAYSDYTWDDMVRELGSRDGFLILKKPFDAIEVRQIAQALSQKWLLTREKEAALQSLERQVERRTAELERAITQLRAEMTDRLRLEKELRHAQKLEALGRLMAGIGHEINNPLAYVLSNIEYSQGELGRVAREPSVERIQALGEVLEEARLGAERIRRIVNSAREFSRPREEAARAVNVEESFGSAIRIVGNQLRHRATLVECFEPVPHVLADPHRLEQVFVNLLMNALEALEDDRGPHEIRVRTSAAGDAVLVEITDTGRGIPESDLERVFDPFFSTRPVGQGTGLGLWICRGIVESFGGRIQFQSEVGRGTTARVVLQRATEVQPLEIVKRPSRHPAPNPTRARVLVIDDEPAVLRALARLLSAHEVTTMNDARTAVDVYRTQEFDVVFCDLMMPGFGGMEFFQAIDRLGPEHSSRIVMMTGGVFTESIRDFLASIENPCIAKPFERGQLQRMIELRLEERSPSAPRIGAPHGETSPRIGAQP